MTRSGGKDPTTHFLKILLQQNDPGRRRRMYREVAAYQTFQHPRIPKLIDSNAQAYEDPTFKLYMVTQYIEGPTLTEFVTRNGSIAVDSCLAMTLRILDVLEYCHKEDWVHRDIKPDNIILRGGSSAEPMIVDFGLSFNKPGEERSRTPSLEELGNRFLRLPELSAGSPSKGDPRSDLTSCAGVLFYGITGVAPSLLLDHNRRLPHQRSPASRLLEQRVEPARLRRLLALFDRSFDIDLNRRWQSAAELRSAIERIDQTGPAPENELSILRQRMDEERGSTRQEAAQMNSRALQIAMSALMRVTGDISSRLGDLLGIAQTNYRVDPFAAVGRNSLAIHRAGRQPSTWVTFTVSLVGSEMVVDAESNGRTERIFRTAANQPIFGHDFDNAVEIQLLRHWHNDSTSP